jgi:hypothetical protein
MLKMLQRVQSVHQIATVIKQILLVTRQINVRLRPVLKRTTISVSVEPMDHYVMQATSVMPTERLMKRNAAQFQDVIPMLVYWLLPLIVGVPPVEPDQDVHRANSVI